MGVGLARPLRQLLEQIPEDRVALDLTRNAHEVPRWIEAPGLIRRQNRAMNHIRRHPRRVEQPCYRRDVQGNVEKTEFLILGFPVEVYTDSTLDLSQETVVGCFSGISSGIDDSMIGGNYF